MSDQTLYLLSQEEVEELPEGTKVVITWSGGNGPHQYVIARHPKTGYTYAALNDDPSDRLRFHNPIDFVGIESFHTHVSVVSDGD